MSHTRDQLTMLCVTALAALPCACTSDFELATQTCKALNSTAATDAAVSDAGEIFDAHWTTGFENGFCDYEEGGGFCYTTGAASYRVVTSPVHNGHYAAAYTVVSGGDGSGYNSRCVRQGILPERAYFHAWYYIPAVATNSGTWNLWHFQGDEDSKGFLDISLLNKEGGGLRLEVYTFGKSTLPDQKDAPAIPIGSWFRISVLLKRSAEQSGEIAVYQDTERVFDLSNVRTDGSKSGQWYVGNFASDLSPAESTLYVDDVMVNDTL